MSPGFHTSLQVGPLARLGWQAQGWQPRPLVKFQKLGAQWSQLRPWTWGRHGHCPVLGSQWHRPVDGHRWGSVPRRLQVQPGQAEKDNHQGVLSPAGATPTISSYIPTHGDSSVGQLAHGSQSCSGHSGVPLCCANNASIAPCGDHRHPGPWRQCFHCTHTVGTCHLALMGPQSAQGHKLHT